MNPVNGLLLIDKASGPTSHDVVRMVRRLLGIRAIGHAGTLDPLASGLLVLLVGEGTKVSDYLLNGEKGYEVEIRLGLTTDSMDITGTVTAESTMRPESERLAAEIEKMSGVLQLAVPAHSAVKVDGRKLYEFAHRGLVPAELPVREMRFFDVSHESYQGDSFLVKMKCSKGSFVRAWVHELGNRLGCGAAVANLRRVWSHPFSVDTAIGVKQLGDRWAQRTAHDLRSLGSSWIPLRDALPHFSRVDVDGRDETLMRHGQISDALKSKLLRFAQPGKELPPVRVVGSETQDLLALLVADPGNFYRIRRVFHRV